MFEVDAGTTIIQQGDRGDAFFILLGRMVEVLNREPDGNEVRRVELSYCQLLCLKNLGSGGKL